MHFHDHDGHCSHILVSCFTVVFFLIFRWIRTNPAVPSPPTTPWQVDTNNQGIMWMEWSHDYRSHKDSSIHNGRDIDAYHLQVCFRWC
jgi:hypothetical protein